MKNVQLVIMVLAAIFAMSAFSVDARLNNHQLVLKAMGIKTVSSHPSGENCICNRKYPPDCRCPEEGEICNDTCANICSQYPPPLHPTCRCGNNEKDHCSNEKPDKVTCLCNLKYPPDCRCSEEGKICDKTCADICSQYYPPPFGHATCRCGDNEKDLCASDVTEMPDKEK